MAFDIADNGNGIVTLTLSGPNGNSLNTAQILELADIIGGCGQRQELRSLILTGAGGTFCRGRIGAKGLTSASAVADDLGAILKVNAALDALDVPVIAAVEGEAFGFAFGLAAQSDYTVAADDAIFALPEMSHGLPPLIVLSYLFRFVAFKRAMELSLTSRKISAKEAENAGIVTEIVRAGAALPRAIDVANSISSMDRKSVALLRKFGRRTAAVHSPALSEHAVSLMSVVLAERSQQQPR